MKNSSYLGRRVREVAMQRMNGSAGGEERDFLAAEEPLEIRVEDHGIAIVMRTPGEDHELAAGFLVTEGLVHTTRDLVAIRHRPHCLLPVLGDSRQRDEVDEAVNAELLALSDGNVINVRLRSPESLDLKKLHLTGTRKPTFIRDASAWSLCDAPCCGTAC